MVKEPKQQEPAPQAGAGGLASNPPNVAMTTPVPQFMPPIMPKVTPPDQTDYINSLLDTLSAQANLIQQYQTILGLAPLITPPAAAPASNGGSSGA